MGSRRKNTTLNSRTRKGGGYFNTKKTDIQNTTFGNKNID
jgi:hypothetical protein